MNERFSIENLWAAAHFYLMEEGGVWIEKIQGQAFGTADFHGLRFRSGREWDVINGFRELKDDTELGSIFDNTDALLVMPERFVVA